MTDLKEIQEIVSESGNSFHCKVTNYLRGKGWHTLVSPYYLDSTINKPREIDLVAEKSWCFEDGYERKYGNITVKLFIECKYISQPNVFWFSDKDVVSARNWVTSNTPLRSDNAFTEEHHYLSTNPKVAKLFASKNKSNAENEIMYKALNQSLNAMIYLRKKGSIAPNNQGRSVPTLATVELPVILCNSFAKFFRVEMELPGNPGCIDDNFQLEVNYAYINSHNLHMSEYFLIDIVEFDRLDQYLDLLEKDKAVIEKIL